MVKRTYKGGYINLRKPFPGGRYERLSSAIARYEGRLTPRQKRIRAQLQAKLDALYAIYDKK